MRMLCYKCGHSWNYRGKNIEGTGYITCPDCMYKIRADKAMIDEPSSEQKLLTSLPRKRILPKKLLSKLPTTNEIKEIPLKIKEPVLKDLQKEVDLDSEIDLEFKIYRDQFGEKITIREIKNDLDIKIIPRDPIKLLEHQQSFL